jgi:hypothetical protein
MIHVIGASSPSSHRDWALTEHRVLDTVKPGNVQSGPELAGLPKIHSGKSMHLVDTTLFFSPTSGGVKRYLTAKHAWLAAHSSWEHSIVVPGSETQMTRGGVSTLAALTLPGTFN